MQTNLISFLKELANHEELLGNKLAWTLAKYSKINKDNRESFYESLLPFYPIGDVTLEPLEIEKDSESLIIDSYYSKDYRIKSMQLSNIRGIPNKEGKQFGIDFSVDGKPKNNIILGSNGVGKSSVYAALEYLFCEKIGEAQLRTYGEEIKEGAEYFKNYLTRFDNFFKNINCSVLTQAGEFHLHGEKPFPKEVKGKLNPETHFVSDYDIYSFGKYEYEGASDKSFHNLIAISLGLSDFLNFNRLINEFIYWDRRKEKLSISKFTKEKQSNDNDIKIWNDEINKRKLKLIEFDKNSKVQVKTVYTGISELFEKTKNNNIVLNIDISEYTDAIKNFDSKYLELSGFNISVNEQKEFEFLILGLELLENQDNCPFCLNSKSETHSIKDGVNQRIERINKYNEIRKATIESYDRLVSKTNDLNVLFAKIIDSLKKENEGINVIPDLINIHSINKDIIQRISELLETNFLRVISNYPAFSINNSKIVYETEVKHTNDFVITLKGLIEAYKAYKLTRNIEINKSDKSIKEKIGDKTILEQRTILTKEIVDFENKIKSITIRNDSIDKELFEFNQRLELYNEIKREADTYSKILSRNINDIVDSAYEPIKNVVEEILGSYLLQDDVTLKVCKDDVVDKETGEIITQVIAARLFHRSNPKLTITPNKYFNTFRYRLFSMMVGISVAIASRKQTGINLPLVLDDVFYASDFEKRTTIIDFIKNLINVFKVYSNQELQLILFTHDELIFDSVMSAFYEMGNENDTVFSKLLPFQDAEPNNNFFELTYRMPNIIPELTLN